VAQKAIKRPLRRQQRGGDGGGGCRLHRWMPGNAHLANEEAASGASGASGASVGGFVALFPCNWPGDATLNQSKADIG